MKEPREGPIERKFWMLVMALTVGPLAICIGVVVVGEFIGRGHDAANAISPLFLFGMVMVGVAIVAPTIKMLISGDRDWWGLILGSCWLLYFGRSFLQVVGAI